MSERRATRVPRSSDIVGASCSRPPKKPRCAPRSPSSARSDAFATPRCASSRETSERLRVRDGRPGAGDRRAHARRRHPRARREDVGLRVHAAPRRGERRRRGEARARRREGLAAWPARDRSLFPRATGVARRVRDAARDRSVRRSRSRTSSPRSRRRCARSSRRASRSSRPRRGWIGRASTSAF